MTDTISAPPPDVVPSEEPPETLAEVPLPASFDSLPLLEPTASEPRD